MTIAKKLAATVPFAHLLGIRAESETEEDKKEREDQEAKKASWSKKAESDDDRKQRDGESDEEYAQRMEEMDDEEDKKAKSSSESDPEEDLEDNSEETKAVRQHERVRCAKIIAHGIKNGCVNQAGVFAFDTSMTAAQAISALNAGKIDASANSRSSLSGRMAGVAIPNVGADGSDKPDLSDPRMAAKISANAIIAAAAKARGEKV